MDNNFQSMQGYQKGVVFRQPVRIFLKSGAQFCGVGSGMFSHMPKAEFVFCTAMTGIEESLTDPSFAEQAIVSTVSHVGNTGYTERDKESSQIWAEGLVCRHLSESPSSWRSKSPLSEWILRENKFVVENVNTRRFTEHLRDHGSQVGFVVLESELQKKSHSEITALLNSLSGIASGDLTSKVTCENPYEFNKRLAQTIVVYDYGCKKSTFEILDHQGFNVQVVPANTPAADVLDLKPRGVLLSNGPGDPGAATYLHKEIRTLIGKVPLFAICLGHQLLAHALGARTYKMKYGHRGIHHPVNELDLNSQEVVRTWITSQNHGYAVDFESLGKEAKLWFVHADDSSVEGYRIPEWNLWSVQFHPEAAPGPYDAKQLLEKFCHELRKDFSHERRMEL